MSNPMKMYIRILSPVHIGCDEVYEPMAFTVDQSNRKLITFDPLDFFRSLSPQDKASLSAICRKGTVESLLELYKFMQGKKCFGPEVDLSNGFLKLYKRIVDMSVRDKRRIQQELNNLTVSRTAFNTNTAEPYLPGSAIKGSLRTAYLNSLAASAARVPSPKGKNAGQQLERTLLDGGSFETDPFRMLKISDFMPVGAVKKKVVFAVNKKKKQSNYEARGPYQIVEVIEPEALFCGTVTIEAPQKEAGIKNPLTAEKLLESLKQFYEKEKLREDQQLLTIDVVPVAFTPQNGSRLMRIGRHSGAESLTIEGHRDIRIMKGRGQRDDHSKDGATTFWLASEEDKPRSTDGLQPFGWVSIGEMTEEVEQDFVRLKNEAQEQAAANTTVGESAMKEEVSSVRNVPEAPVREAWPAAILSWTPGSQTVTAKWEDKTAVTKDRSLVPDALGKKLFGKSKIGKGCVTVEIEGNKVEIIKIEPVG